MRFIETERLFLRNLDLSDKDSIYAYMIIEIMKTVINIRDGMTLSYLI